MIVYGHEKYITVGENRQIIGGQSDIRTGCDDHVAVINRNPQDLVLLLNFQNMMMNMKF